MEESNNNNTNTFHRKLKQEIEITKICNFEIILYLKYFQKVFTHNFEDIFLKTAA